MLPKRGRTLRSHPLQLEGDDSGLSALAPSRPDASTSVCVTGWAATTQASSSGGTLDDDCLVEVLRVSQPAGTLSLLASSSRHTCSLARSRLPLHLRITTKAQASLLLRSLAAGRPPFSGCTQLTVQADDTISCFMAAGVLSAAQQWSGLQQIHLTLPAAAATEEVDPDGTLDCIPRMMGRLSGLSRLRDLQLGMASWDSSSMQLVLSLTQLTGLQLAVRKPEPTAATTSAAASIPADLSGMSGLTNLRAPKLSRMPAVQPAAAGGPHCLPSSITRLALVSGRHAAPMACWLTHLPGCPALQHLHLHHGGRHQHPSAHPSALAPLLAQHNPQLRSWVVDDWKVISWGTPVAGLPAGADRASRVWRPTAALSGLIGLDCLRGRLCLDEEVGWRHLAAMPDLTQLERAHVGYAPPQQAGTSLGVLELEDCLVLMDGYGLGLLLLACPLLQRAKVSIVRLAGGAVQQLASSPRLPAHPKLQALSLGSCGSLQEVPTAAAGFDALVPVLGGVSSLTLRKWKVGSRRARMYSLPNLSACTALTSLKLQLYHERGTPSARGAGGRGAFRLMLAPLLQLQRLEVSNSTVRECEMRELLPRLQSVQL
jgi:hypothetical protein